jgi:polysaccharide biosynthesis/export protein
MIRQSRLVMSRNALMVSLVAMAVQMSVGGQLAAQSAAPAAPKVSAPTSGGTAVAPAKAAAGSGVSIPPVAPPDYVIGPDDVLSIVFWRDNDMSTEVVVRPDGRISLPVINDVVAMGLTPDQLRQTLTEAANRYVEDPNVSVVVKEIKSRRVFITGQVSKAGPYALMAPMTVVQLIAIAGGLSEFAKAKDIVILRQEPGGGQSSIRFNYRDVMNRKKLRQNIELKPGDTVIVP